MALLPSSSMVANLDASDTQSTPGVHRFPSDNSVSTLSDTSSNSRQIHIKDPKELVKLVVQARKENGGVDIEKVEGGPYGQSQSFRLKGLQSRPDLAQSLLSLFTTTSSSPASSSIRLPSTAPTSQETLASTRARPRRIPSKENGVVIMTFDAPDRNPDLILSPLQILDVLQNIMESRGLPSATPIFEFADLVCGSGEGGLLALAISTFKMTTQEARDFYLKCTSRSFKPSMLAKELKSVMRESATKHTERLEFQIRDFVKEHYGDENVSMDAIDFGCYGFVVATKHGKVNMAKPTTFANYNPPSTPPAANPSTQETLQSPIEGPSCPLWQAALATMATPHHYDPQIINGTKYVGGSTGTANPAEVAEAQARRLFPGKDIALILSIGPGSKKSITAHNPRMGAREHTKGGSRVHTNMKRFHSEEAIGWTRGRYATGAYYRFEVPHLASKATSRVPPMAAWKAKKLFLRLTHITLKKGVPGLEMSTSKRRRIIEQETGSYLQQPDVKADLEFCADVLVRRYREKRKETAKLDP